ncbi:WD40 repeat domain-containing protein [Arundinibacter roseus]|uniref:Novel STAND NTPase 1 domain-containing protein n=1 Tax=Arundinibacter roseus TaxID=2070510 RepID=A0A4R4KB94_9BACT|nr:hypothetical protein [Arundinibacter roseus]TDB64012.1 hypothetical protein EZE20_13790 [Arundinibacter roseus]
MSVNSRYTNPFPGLRSFESQDSDLFFGRESHIKVLRNKLSLTRFLAIVASSGSGKSSLIKAGLIPSLRREKLQGAVADAWEIILFKPGAKPLTAFCKAIYRALYGSSAGYEAFEEELKHDPQAVFPYLKKMADKNILLVIDQFEEAFRYAESEPDDSNVTQTTRLIALILRLIVQQECQVYVVLTMRSDYLDECTNYPGFTEVINEGYYLLPKMNPEEIRQAITQPVVLKGAVIAPGLTERLLTEVHTSYDPLPILQHALMRTWDYWEKHDPTHPLDEVHYEAIGTMKEAISRHAEEIYHALPDSQSRVATERLFKALIVLAPGDIGIMRPARLRTIVRVTGMPEDVLMDVINRFRQQGTSILTPSYTQKIDRESFVDISLEKIMLLWERLREWIQEETESAKLYKKLGVSAQLNQAGKTGLLINPELQTALKWLKEKQPSKEWAEKHDPYFERVINYLDHSRIEYENTIKSNEDKQKRELKRARYFAIVMGIGSLMSLLFLVISLVLRYDAEQSRKQSLEKEKLAMSERSRAEEQTKESISQKRIAEQQEMIAEQQRRLTEEQRSIAVREQQLAQVKRLEAEVAKQVAVLERMKADTAQRIAVKQKDLAVLAKAEADLMRFQADSARRVAILSQKDAEEQRGKAIARSVAIQSYQMADNAQDALPGLLAIQAYRFNVRNKGQADNPDIFRALSKATDSKTILRWHRDIVRTLVPTGKADQYASTGDDGTVKLWSTNLDQQPTVQTFATAEKVAPSLRAIGIAADGASLLAGSSRGMLYHWSTADPAALPKVVKAHAGVVTSIIVPKKSSQVITVGGDGTIRTWKLSANGLDSLQNLKSGIDIFCARLTPDGKRLACGSSKGRVVIFDLANLDKEPETYNYYGFGTRVTALAFSPSGTNLITANSSGALYQWNFTKNKIDRIGLPLSGRHTSSVNDIVFSPNGAFMATCSYDWTVHLWNYENISNRQIQPIVIDDYDTWVLGLAFSPDSKQLVACGADRTIRAWNIDPRDLYEQVVKKADRDMTVDEWNRFIGKDIPYEKIVQSTTQ